jgi:hypothetical protein
MITNYNIYGQNIPEEFNTGHLYGNVVVSGDGKKYAMATPGGVTVNDVPANGRIYSSFESLDITIGNGSIIANKYRKNGSIAWTVFSSIPSLKKSS